MKRVKLIPTFLMVILCVSLLTVGVLSAQVNSSTVSGTISIDAWSPISASVETNSGINGNTVSYQKKSDGEYKINSLTFSTAGKKSVAQVEDITITISLKNYSKEKSFGAYFFDPESTIPTADDDTLGIKANYACADNILTKSAIYDKTDTSLKLVDVYFSSYTYMDVQTETENPYSTIEMEIRFSLASLTASTISDSFSYQLKTEEYIPNSGELVAGEGTTAGNTFTGALLKVDNDLNTSIPTNAFYGNTTITHIVIPSNITSIGDNIFGGSNTAPTGIKGITIPSSVETFGTGCFYFDKNIESVTCNIIGTGFSLINGVLEINNQTALTAKGWENYRTLVMLVNFNDTSDNDPLTTFIGQQFNYLCNLRKINVPSVIITWNLQVFSNCSSLEYVYIEDGIESIGGGGAFQTCESLKEIILPETLTYIAFRSFTSCKALVSITIPSSVTELGTSSSPIGNIVFGACTNLTTIIIEKGVGSGNDFDFYASLPYNYTMNKYNSAGESISSTTEESTSGSKIKKSYTYKIVYTKVS